MLILNLGELFKSRPDYIFYGNESRENKIWIMDEESKHEGAEDAYPRITLHRNGSRYMHIGGFNDSHEFHEHFNTQYSRSDIFSHNFTFRVKAIGFGVTENLAYLVSFFMRFYEKELVLLNPKRRTYELRHEGMSQVVKAGEATEQRSIYQCDISFTVQDHEIAKFLEETYSKKFENFCVEAILPEVIC